MGFRFAYAYRSAIIETSEAAQIEPMKLLVLLIVTAIPAVAHAGLYRWVDENGVTQYSQTAPLGRDADKLKPPPPPAEDPQEARRRLDQQLQKVDDQREDRELAAEERRRREEEQRIRQQNCANARTNLERLGRTGRRLVRLPDGSYTRLTEEERQERMRKAQEIIQENCE